MTIDDAIKALEDIKKKHGNTLVFFDCPTCRQSFTPVYVAIQGTHFKTEVKE